MIAHSEPIDEFLLAAYLSEGLPPSLRSEIEEYLLTSSCARELLGMATEALDEARTLPSGEVVPELVPVAEKGSQKAEARHLEATRLKANESRAGFLNAIRSVSFFGNVGSKHTVMFVLSLILVLIVLLGWSMIPGNGVEAGLDARTVSIVKHLTPVMDKEENTARWSAVPGAASYAIVVLNGKDNAIVNVSGTETNRVSDLQEIVYTFRTSYTAAVSFLVVALDHEGAFLESSNPIQLGTGN